MTEQTIRTQMLLGEAALARLRSSSVAVLGLGGVGSWCAEALARAGVGAAVTVLMMLVPIAIFVFSQSNIIDTMASSGMKD